MTQYDLVMIAELIAGARRPGPECTGSIFARRETERFGSLHAKTCVIEQSSAKSSVASATALTEATPHRCPEV